MMQKSVLGIDLGTSSVKILQLYQDGTRKKARAGYREISRNGWWEAVKQALSMLDLEQVVGIGLSAQVGTYIVNDSWINSWNSGNGAEKLEALLQKYEPETFLNEISMPHPHLTSYPLPQLSCILEQKNDLKVCQPKDFICEMLTGNLFTDRYSWRGLANLETGQYSKKLLEDIGFPEEKLPKIIGVTELAGVTQQIKLKPSRVTELPAGIPVFTGMNDFFSALLGMGICHEGDLFDISGTSEHIGVLEEQVQLQTEMVSGPYLLKNVHYGVTASSGVSLAFGMELLQQESLELETMIGKRPPIFLPYLNGERAPIWDADARGMFFGIEAGCTKKELAYAVLEGVAFSLYHIYEKLGKPDARRICLSGGAAVNPLLNRLKAELFGLPIEIQAEKDSSALGAAMTAGIGLGWFADYEDAAAQVCKMEERIEPTGAYQSWLMSRYDIYKELYPAVKAQCRKFSELPELSTN